MRTLLLSLVLCSYAAAAQSVIWDDDCSSDIDCAFTSASVWKLADQGYINVLAVMADSQNVQAIAALHVFAGYYGYANKITFAANQANTPSTSYCTSNNCNVSTQPSAGNPWYSQLVAQFNPGDTRANYPDCVTTYRKVLAAQPNSSVIIVATGFLTCLYPLLSTPADGISPLTGAQLVKAKVSALSLCCGFNPTGTEFNYASDVTDSGPFFAAWTTGNGYPPIWQIDAATGNGIRAGPAHYALATVNPVYYVENITGNLQRGTWDSICMLWAAWGMVNPKNGMTLWTDGGNGTQSVNSSTGVNTWSTATASGHHYLSLAATIDQVEQIFDSYAHGFGFISQPAGASTGSYVHGGVTFRGTAK